MKLSLSIALLGLVAHALTGYTYIDDQLEARNADVNDLYLRDSYEGFPGVHSRSLPYQGLYGRELSNGELEDMVVRSFNEDYYAGYARDYRRNLVAREEGYQTRLAAREPLGYRIGVVIPNKQIDY